MTHRDLGWRAAGVALVVGGCLVGMLDREGSPLTIVCFVATLVGIALLLNGKRVGVLLKAERRGHGGTAAAIRMRRSRSDQTTLNS